MSQTATGKTEDLKYQTIYLKQVLPCTREIFIGVLKLKQFTNCDIHLVQSDKSKCNSKLCFNRQHKSDQSANYDL